MLVLLAWDPSCECPEPSDGTVWLPPAIAGVNECVRCQKCIATDGKNSSRPTPYKHKDMQPRRLCTSSQWGTGASVSRSRPHLSDETAPSPVWFGGKEGALGEAESADVACGRGRDVHVYFRPGPCALARRSSLKRRRWCAAGSGAAAEGRGQHRSHQTSSRGLHNELGWIQRGPTDAQRTINTG